MAAKRRVVLKFGTGILTLGGGLLNLERISDFCSDVAALRNEGTEFVIVSSGAVGLGMGKLGLQQRPQELQVQQACASIGQAKLIQDWQKSFDPFGITVGQILLTREDLRSRQRHLAARATIEHLLALGVIPIINENDAISAEEIKFGDNDMLSALTSSLIHAELLVILSTAPGLMENPIDGAIVPVVEQITERIEAMAGGTTSATAVGGMVSKIEAAKVATRSGTTVIICSGEQDRAIHKALSEGHSGTRFLANADALPARKRWIAYFEDVLGTIVVDEGARTALCQHGSSLLVPGIVSIEGDFPAEGKVEITDEKGQVFARGLSSQSAAKLRLLLQEARHADAAAPRGKVAEAVHRDSLVLLQAKTFKLL